MNLSLWPSHYIPPRMAHRSDYLERAALVLGVSIAEIRRKSRARNVSQRRYAIADVMKRRLDYSYTQIGDALHIDHSSAIHAVQRSAQLIKEIPRYAQTVRALEMVA